VRRKEFSVKGIALTNTTKVLSGPIGFLFQREEDSPRKGSGKSLWGIPHAMTNNRGRSKATPRGGGASGGGDNGRRDKAIKTSQKNFRGKDEATRSQESRKRGGSHKSKRKI